MKNVIGGTFETLNEAIVKPVADQFGQAIEQGTKTSSPTPQTPLNPVQGSQVPVTPPDQLNPAEQATLLETRRKLDYWNGLAARQAKFREESKAKDTARLAQANQDQKIRQFETVERRKVLPQLKGKPELKGGVGG